MTTLTIPNASPYDSHATPCTFIILHFSFPPLHRYNRGRLLFQLSCGCHAPNVFGSENMFFLFISSFPISFLTHLFICFPSFPLIFRFFSDFQQYYGIPHFYGILHSTRFIHLSPIHTLPTLSHLHPLHSQTTSASARPCQIAPIRRKPRLYSSCPHHPTISNPLQRLIFVEPFKPLSTRTSPP